MAHDTATAYACVAYHVMEYDGGTLTEEQFEVILEMLFGFYDDWGCEKSPVKKERFQVYKPGGVLLFVVKLIYYEQ